jgi:hypothetical protein
MNEQELFEAVLVELDAVVRRLDCPRGAVLIGGQVLAVEQLAAGRPAVFVVETDTGQRIDRGFSMEPDLLVDPPAVEDSPRWDEIPHLLRELGARDADDPARGW